MLAHISLDAVIEALPEDGLAYGPERIPVALMLAGRYVKRRSSLSANWPRSRTTWIPETNGRSTTGNSLAGSVRSSARSPRKPRMVLWSILSCVVAVERTATRKRQGRGVRNQGGIEESSRRVLSAL